MDFSHKNLPAAVSILITKVNHLTDLVERQTLPVNSATHSDTVRVAKKTAARSTRISRQSKNSY